MNSSLGFWRVVLAAILIAVSIGPIRAQHYLIDNYTEASGLPSSQVFSVTQDASGRMRFFTASGVATYDGRNWWTQEVEHDVPPELGGHQLWDHRNHLWVVPRIFEGTLSRFDGSSWTAVAGPEALEAGTAIPVLTTGVHGDLDVQALGSGDGSIHLRIGGEWHQVNGSREVARCLLVHDGKLFAGVDSGLWTLELGDPALVLRQSRIVDKPLRGIAVDADGASIWLVGETWVGRLHEEHFELLHEGREPIANSTSRSIVEPDRNGGIYVGDWTALWHFSPKSGLERLGPANGLHSDGATDLFVDRESNAWVATLRGVSKLISDRFATYRKEHGLFEDEVTAVLERASGEILLGHPHGITRFGDEMRELELVDRDRHARIIELAEDLDGSVWAAMEGRGLARIEDTGRIEWRSDLPDSIRSVVVDDDGVVWAVSAEGVHRKDGERFELFKTPDDLSCDRVRRIFHFGDSMYLATAGAGLWRLRSGHWEHWLGEGNAEIGNVFTVLEHRDVGVLIGTGAGLYSLRGHQLVEANPRVGRPVYFLALEGRSMLWIGTDNGVILRHGNSIEHFTVNDGLAGTETNRAAGVVDSRGWVWIGTNSGVSIYRAERDRRVAVPPIVELLSVTSPEGIRVVGDDLELSHDDNDLAFRFRAVSFLDESRVMVRARLDGHDSDWLPSERLNDGEARYTNLAPGRYRFQVQAANAHGVWSEIVSSQEITVLAPFWTRTRFVFAGVAALVACALLGQHFLQQRRYTRRLELDVKARVEQQRRAEEELGRALRLESLGTLAGGIAHDFNNLMTVILGNVFLVQSDPDVSQRSRSSLASAETALARARELTGQLLTFSRGGEPVRQAATLNELIRSAAGFVLSGTNTRCEFEGLDDLRVVDIDTSQINQVVSNLLLNASEAMPGGGTVKITGQNLNCAPPGLKAGRYVEFAVHDQGEGITQGTLERIFDPYFSTKERGSGLGLATAYSIVNRHGGTLTVESTPGLGATFRVLLPASTVREIAPKPPAPAIVSGSGRILLMDDDEDVRKVTARLLQRLGYSVDGAEHGQRAIELYRQSIQERQPFDLVLLDLTVRGGMGGREAITRLIEMDPQVRAIVISGYSHDPVMANYRQFGFSGRLAKPFRIETLAQLASKIIARANTGGAVD